MLRIANDNEKCQTLDQISTQIKINQIERESLFHLLFVIFSNCQMVFMANVMQFASYNREKRPNQEKFKQNKHQVKQNRSLEEENKNKTKNAQKSNQRKSVNET